MKSKHWLILGIVTLVLVAAGSYFYATAMMDSLMEYRSPLAETAPEPGSPLGEPLTRRVVILLVDALREDTALNPEVMPVLNELRQQGAWATMHSQTPSYSAPGWTAILTGAWPDINDGQSANPPDDNSVRAFTQDDIFAAASRSGLRSAVSGYTWFEGMLANSGVDAGFYTPGEDHVADLKVMEAALPWLVNEDYQLVLIHLDQVDYAGHHEGGPLDPNWDAAARRVDAMIGQIVSYLDLEQDTLIVISDHGQIDRGGHGGQDPVTLAEPFVMAGASIIPGHHPDIEMVDIAPTVAALLGTNIPASTQGRALTEMLTITPGQEAKINQALAEQQYQLFTDYQSAIGGTAEPQPLQDSINSIKLAMGTIKIQRLQRERVPRFFVALILALIPAAILYKKRSRAVAWLLCGTAIYLIAFNSIYALISEKTYSLSSVTGATDLIISTAIYAGTGLFLAWLVLMGGLNAFTIPASSAARLTLALTAVTLYFLLIPALWNYYRNGFLISWTLPEFGSMFFGFLSTVQSLFVAAIGMLLSGLAALIAKFVPNK